MEELKKLYDAVSENFDIGTFEDFSSKMKTPDDRKRFYDAVGTNGFSLGDYQDYENRLKNIGNPKGVSAEQSGVSDSVSASGGSSSESKKTDTPNPERELMQQMGDAYMKEQNTPEAVAEREVKKAKQAITKTYDDAYNYAVNNIDQAGAEERYNDELTQNTLWKNTKKGFRNFHNTWVGKPSNAIARMVGSDADFTISEPVPLEEETKQAKKELLKENPDSEPTTEQIQERAKNIFIDNDIQNQMHSLVDKALPSGYDREGVWKELKLKSLRNNDILRSKIASAEMYKSQIEEFKDFYEGIDPENPTQEEVEKYNALREKAISAVGQLENLSENFDTFLSQAKTDEEKLELFKYNYNDWEKNTTSFLSTLENIGAGALKLAGETLEYGNKKALEFNSERSNTVLGKLGMASNVSNIILGKVMSDVGSDTMEENEKLTSQFYRYKASDIHNWSDFGSVTAQVVSEQLPILATMYLGGNIGLGIVSASSGGQKIHEMETEEKSGGKKFSDGEKLISGYLYTASEGLPERLGTVKILKDIEKTVNSASKSSRKLFNKGALKEVSKQLPESLKKLGYYSGLETATERVTTESQILIDEEFLGIELSNQQKREMRAESDFASAIMGGGMAMTGGMLSIVAQQAKTYSDKKDVREVKDILKKIDVLRNEIDTNDLLTNKEVSELYREMNVLNNQAFDIVERNAIKGADLSVEEKSFLIDINTQQEELRAKAKETADSNLSEDLKKAKLKELESQFDELENKRNTALSGEYTPLMNLSSNEVLKIKNRAGRELQAEMEAQGVEEFTITDEQITQRAIEIYNRENKSETITEQTQQIEYNGVVYDETENGEFIRNNKDGSKTTITDQSIIEEVKEKGEIIQKNTKFVTDESTGTEISQRSPQEEQRGSESVHSQEQDYENRLGERVRETETQLQRPLNKHEQEDLERQVAFDFANQENIWVGDLYSLGNQPLVGGNENTLALDKESGVVYKSNNLFNSQNSISQFFEGIENFNAVFPDNKYTFVGFTGTENKGKTPYVEPIVVQDYIPNAEQATQSEIDAYMESIGFEKVNDHTFKNNEYTASDLRPRNVLKDSDGNIHVIDSNVTQNNKQQTNETTQSQNTDVDGEVRPRTGVVEQVQRDTGQDNKGNEDNRHTAPQNVESETESRRSEEAVEVDAIEESVKDVKQTSLDDVLKEETAELERIEKRFGKDSVKAKEQRLLIEALESQNTTEVSVEKGKVKVTGRGAENKSERNKAVKEAVQDGLYDNEPRVMDDAPTDLQSEEDVANYVAENSNNPIEIAEEIERQNDNRANERNLSSARDFVLDFFEKGGRITQNVLEELFGGNKGGERKSISGEVQAKRGLISNNGANTIDNIAHAIWDNNQEQFTTEELRNAVEEVLGDSNTIAEMRNELYGEQGKSDAQIALEEKFTDITGLPATKDNVKLFAERGNQVTDSNKNTEPQSSLDEMSEKELSKLEQEKNSMEKFLDILDVWEKNVDKFGRETLGMNIPVVVAKGAIKTMRVATKAGLNLTQAYKAGINYIKGTDWYKNLSIQDKLKIDEKTFKTVVNNAVRQVIDLENKVNEIRSKLKDDKTSKKEVVDDLKDFLKQNKIEGKITPTEVNRLINYATQIATAKDPQKAFDRFLEEFNKIELNASLRNNSKKTISERSEIISKVDDMLSNNASETDIIDSFETQREKDIAKDYIERNRELTDEQAYEEWQQTSKEYEEQLRNRKPFKRIAKEIVKGIKWILTTSQGTLEKNAPLAGLRRTANLIRNYHGAKGLAKSVFDDTYNSIYGIRVYSKDKKTGERKWYQGSLNRAKRKVLDDIIFLRRVIEIENNREQKGLEPIMHTGGMNKTKAESVLRQLEKELGKETYNDLVNRSDIYFDTFRKLLKDKYDAGFLTKEAYDEISNLNYQPRVLLSVLTDYDGDLSERGKNNRKRSNGGLSDNDIKSLGEGSLDAFSKKSEWLLASALSSGYRNIAQNNINNMAFRELEKQKPRFEKLQEKVKNKEKLSHNDQNFYDAYKELSEKIIDNPVVGINEKTGKPKYKHKKPPHNFVEAYRWEKGVRKPFFIEERLSQEWFSQRDGFIKPEAKKIISLLTGSALVKYFATGNNPFFFISNTPRDAVFNYAFSDEYSAFMPLGAMQVAKETAKASVDIVKNNYGLGENLLETLIEYGLSMEFLSTQGRVKSNKLMDLIPKNYKDNINFVWKNLTAQKMQTANELMFRVALAQKTIVNFLKEHNLKSADQITDDVAQQKGYENKQDMLDDMYETAVAEARGILDFSRGGMLSKDLEAFIPYTNVALQSTDKIVEMFRKKPIETSVKMVQIGASMSVMPVTASLMYMALRNRDDDDEQDKNKTPAELYIETIDGLSSSELTNYSHIPLGKRDKNGNLKSIRISKEHGLTSLLAVTDYYTRNLLRRASGQEEESFENLKKRFSFAIRNNYSTVVTPRDLIQNIPLGRFYDIQDSGYDSFREQFLPGTQASSRFRSVSLKGEGLNNPYVEDFWKQIGEDYNLSPIRTKYAVEAMITSPSTSPLVGLLYGGADVIWSKDKTMEEVRKNLNKNIGNAFKGRVIKSSSDFNRNYNKNQKLQKELEENRFNIEKRNASENILINKFINKEIEPKEFIEEAVKLRPESPDKIVEKYEKKLKNKNLKPEILDLKYAENLEERAIMVLNNYGDILAPENKDVFIELQKAGGILTDSFLAVYLRKRKEYEGKE